MEKKLPDRDKKKKQKKPTSFGEQISMLVKHIVDSKKDEKKKR